MSRQDQRGAFLEESRIEKLAARARDAAERAPRERLRSGMAMPAIDAAIDSGLARRDAIGPRRASILENAAFLLLAAMAVAAHVWLLARMQPAAALGLEVGLNWSAPFVFYIIYRLDRRSARERQGESR